MKQVELDYGTTKMSVELPDTSVVVRYGETYIDPPNVDPIAVTRAALDAPLEMPHLRIWPAQARRLRLFFQIG